MPARNLPLGVEILEVKGVPLILLYLLLIKMLGGLKSGDLERRGTIKISQ
jgi:hypothetical protein